MEDLREVKKPSTFKFNKLTKFRLKHITKKLGNSSMTNTLERMIDREYDKVLKGTRHDERA